jgi:hypothetical protein
MRSQLLRLLRVLLLLGVFPIGVTTIVKTIELAARELFDIGRREKVPSLQCNNEINKPRGRNCEFAGPKLFIAGDGEIRNMY